MQPAAETFAMPPDPGPVVTLDDLVERLRLLKVWAGDPSFERITDRVNDVWRVAGRPAKDLAGKTTVVDCFRPGRRRLNTDLVVAVVQALHPDVGYVTQWRQALRVVGGEIHAASQVRVQDSLPQDLPEFTGRTVELDRLRQAVGRGQPDAGAVVISAIEGMAGVGKTQLAVHAAHMLIDEGAFDRVLFVNLRGFHPDPAQPPADPAAVLEGFLRLLGVPGQQLPHDLDARAAAYRDRLAGSRTLVVLDNAADSEQAGPLLAATPGCLTLVTSRRSLTGLEHATHLAVDVFTPDESVAFLTRAAPGVPVGADPLAVSRIAESCGHLPLALGLVAGQIRGRPGWTLTDHAERLDERRDRRQPENGVELALHLSYQQLSSDQGRLLRLAALHPGQDLDVYSAAALTDTDLTTAQDHLNQLWHDHLLQQAAPDRYSFHDLVRDYAAARAGDEDPPPQRRAAVTRLFDHYLATAAAAVDVVNPHPRQPRPKIAPAGTPTPELDDLSQAHLWLDTELANLLAAAQHAAQHGWPEHHWKLASVLDRHLHTRGRYREAQALHEQTLALGPLLDNPAAEMDAHSGLGHGHRMLAHSEQALEHFGRALQIAQDIGDRRSERFALSGIGVLHWGLGHYDLASDYTGRALRVAQTIGDRAGELDALCGLGSGHWMVGRHEEAADHYERALQIAQEIGDLLGELSTQISLGDVYRMVSSHERAIAHYGRARELAQELGSSFGGLYALNGLADVHRLEGRHEQAAQCYQQVLDRACELGNNNMQFEALQGMGRVHHATGRPDLALTCHEQALQFATDLNHPTDQVRAHDGLGHAHHALNDPGQARQHWQRALSILESLGSDECGDIEASGPNIRARLADLG